MKFKDQYNYLKTKMWGFFPLYTEKLFLGYVRGWGVKKILFITNKMLKDIKNVLNNH